MTVTTAAPRFCYFSVSKTHGDKTAQFANRVFAVNFGWAGFFVVYFLHNIDPNLTKKDFYCGEKCPKCHFYPNFLGLGLALGYWSSSVS